MFGADLEGDELAVGGECSGEPDGGVAAEGSDFEDAVCAFDGGEEMQEFALRGGDVDGGKAGFGVGLQGLIEDGVGGDEVLGDIGVDCGPEFVVFLFGLFVAHGERINGLCSLNFVTGLIALLGVIRVEFFGSIEEDDSR